MQKTYRSGGLLGRRRREVHAVRDVTLALPKGGTLGVVGESGSGKSTLARCITRLVQADGGAIRLDGLDLLHLSKREARQAARRVQMVFQDPLGALDRRLPIATQVGEPLDIHGIGARAERAARVETLLRAVGLRPDQGARYPHELSGGQRQRAVLARALATDPALLVCDEPISALDVSIQAQVMNLLVDLQEQFGTAMRSEEHTS